MRVFICLICVLFLWGCGGAPRGKSSLSAWMEETGRVKVLSTTEIVGDLVRLIGAERVDHIALIAPDLDPHSYELVKGDEEKLSRADLIFCHGLGLEHGASLHHRLQTEKKVLSVGAEIQKRVGERILFQGSEIDPHVWMDISLWKEAVEPIVFFLSQFDPEGEALYRENGKRLEEKLTLLDQEIKEKISFVDQEKRYLITTHDAYNYFARRYLAPQNEISSGKWRERLAAPEGLSPEGQIGFTDLQNVIDFIEAHQIRVVYPEANLSHASLGKIVEVSRAIGHPVAISKRYLYGDTYGSLLGEQKKAEDYFEMMRINTDTLCEGWK